MEQYLDRLADSIRSLNPEGAGAPEMKRRRMQIGWRGKRLAKRIAIGATVLFLLGVGATATWWLQGQQRSTQVATEMPTATMSPKLETATPAAAQVPIAPSPAASIPEEKPLPTVASIATPAPASTSGSVRSSEAPAVPSPLPQQNASAVASFLTSLDNATGRARDEAIGRHVQDLPAQISANNLLSIVDGTYSRNDMIKLLVPRVPSPISVSDALQILGQTRLRQRSELIAILTSHFPPAINTRELLALIEGAYARNDMIKSLVNRLPVSLSLEDTLQILDGTRLRERSELIAILLSRIPAKLRVQDLLAVIENGYARNDLINSLTNRLPTSLSFEETQQILGNTALRERSELIGILSPKLPAKLTVEEMLRIVDKGYGRNELIKPLVNRLPDPLTMEGLVQILSSTSGRERDELIGIIARRAPAHLSSEQVALLVRGGYATADDEKLLKH